MPKTRLDIALTKIHPELSRTQAQTLIMSGQVTINSHKAITSAQMVSENDQIQILEKLRYVSRGGLKLEHALQEFKINPTDQICLDIGASTGGFTDCLLQHGAKQVYAIDVGTHQLADQLKQDPRVISSEQTHFLHLPQLPNPNINLIVIDVSFISVTKILLHLLELHSQLNKNNFNDLSVPAPQMKIVNCKLNIILLLKPQFEAKPGEHKKGVVKNDHTRQKILERFLQFCQNNHIRVLNQTTSPIKGPKGNVEYLLLLKLAN